MDPPQVVSKFSSDTAILVSASRKRRCEVSCRCLCHSAQRYRTPPFIQNLFGTLFMGYTGWPVLSARCNINTCQNPTQGRSIDVVYCFPMWFWQRAVHISATLQFLSGLIFQVQMKRRIPWGGGQDTLLKFALTGNVDGAKSLMGNGKAWLNDIDPNHGRTALHVGAK